MPHARIGYDLIIASIPEGSRILDLGCGDGILMERLTDEKRASCFGVEISEDGVSKCVEKGLYCYQGDIDEGLADYRDNSYDFVILNQTLQNTKRPDNVLTQIMRICRNAIISFPNYGYIKTRVQLLVTGKMPKNDLIPFDWYESPDIHHLTIKDFGAFCRGKKYPVKKISHFNLSADGKSSAVKIMPNLFAQYGFFILDGEKYTDRQ